MIIYKQSKHFLTVDKSCALYGAAIIMMVFHHLFLNIGNLNFEIASLLPNLMRKAAWFCKICVAIYVFISGYGMEKTANNIKRIGKSFELSIKKSFNRYVHLMVKFWIVLLMFLPVIRKMIELNGHQYIWSFRHVVAYIIGWNIETNTAWWYIRLYVFFLMLFPIITLVRSLIEYYVTYKKIHGLSTMLACMLVGISLFFCYHVSAFKSIGTFLENNFISEVYILIFLEGILVAAYDVFDIFKEKVSETLLADIIGLIFIIFLRTMLADDAAYNKIDVLIIVPFVLFFGNLLDRCVNIKRLMCLFGSKSTYMWLLHMFLIYGCSGLILWGKYSIAIYMILLFEAFILACLFEKIEFFFRSIGVSILKRVGCIYSWWSVK